MKKSYGQVSSFLFIKVHLTLLKIFIRKQMGVGRNKRCSPLLSPFPRPTSTGAGPGPAGAGQVSPG